jgi:hypothetical protein
MRALQGGDRAPWSTLSEPPCLVWVAYFARQVAAGGTPLRAEPNGGEWQRTEERKHDEQAVDGPVVYRTGAQGER